MVETPAGVSSDISSGVSEIFSTGSTFAALKTDGSVVVLGDSTNGGNIPSALTTAISSGVSKIFST